METGVEHGDVRDAGERAWARTIPSMLAGLCNGASGEKGAQGRDDVVVDHHRLGETSATVHDPVAHRDEVCVVDPWAVLRERGAGSGEGGSVVGTVEVGLVALPTSLVAVPAGPRRSPIPVPPRP